MEGCCLYPSLPVISASGEQTITSNDTSSVPRFYFWSAPLDYTATAWWSNVVLQRLCVGVSFEDSSLYPLCRLSCVTVWVVSSAFRSTAFSSDLLECLVQSVGSLFSVCLHRFTQLLLCLPGNNLSFPTRELCRRVAAQGIFIT